MDAANRLCMRYRTRATLAGSCLAFGFSILSLTQCSFLSTETSTKQQQTLLGLFSRPFQNDHGESLGCVAYSSIESSTFGSLFKISRAFAVLTALFSGLSAIFMATVLVGKPPKWSKKLWVIAKYALAGATICQMVTFSVLGDADRCGGTDGCSLMGVGILAVFNTVLLAACSISFLVLPLPKSSWLVWWQLRESDVLENVKDAMNLSSQQQQAPPPPPEMMRNQNEEESEEGLSILSSSGSQYDSIRRSVRSETVVTSIQELASFRLITVALIACACSVSVVGVNRCTFLLVGSRHPQGQSLASGSSFAGKGLFSQAIDDDTNGEFLGCVAYSEETVGELDAAFKTGRAFGAITSLLTTTILVLGIAQLFCHVALRQRIWFFLRALLPVITLAQMISFTAFASDVCQGIAECRPGGTGIAVILNVFLLTILSIVVCLVPPPLNPVFKRQRMQDVNGEGTRGPTRQSYPLPPEISTDGRMNHNAGPMFEADSTDDDITDSDELYYSWNADHSKNTIPEKPRNAAGEDDAVESIEVRVEYTDTEKKTIKTINHKDGSKTITTKLEELENEMSLAGEDEFMDIE